MGSNLHEWCVVPRLRKAFDRPRGIPPRFEEIEMSTRLQEIDQPAILEWLPTEMRTVSRYQPTEIKRQRMHFETVAAAVGYATSTLPEGFRHNATIETEHNITLRWADIDAMRTALAGG
jgi:hypothetical protein